MKILLVLCIIFPFTAFAQHWTADEQEVLDQIKKGWSSWEKAVQAKDLNIWIDTFQPADDFTGWWTSDGGLWTLNKEKRTFDNWVKNVNNFYWEGVQPLSIKVYGEVALAYFYSTYTTEDNTGKTTRTEDKRLEVYRKVDGIWRWSDAMVSGKEIGAFVEVKE
jgi:ketosteroid isomerase-like protein